MKKSEQFLDLVGSEVMDSRSAANLIGNHVGLIRDIIGEPENVLVIGCADGTELDMWKSAEGIDLNEESLSKCKMNGHLAQKMDMHDMTFEDNSFELVSSRDVFEHAVSPITAMFEMSRVSSKYVAITIPDSAWQWSEWHFIIPTMKQMITLGEKTNLMLKAYREYGWVLGTEYVKQYLYIFQKDT